MNCTRCHATIPADGPSGMCPKCLLSVGLGEPELVLTDSGEPALPPPTPAELQPHFPQLEIVRLVGRGGMGAVYEARQKGLSRTVALKILAAPARADTSFEERFVREAQALARLSHENIVAVYDAGRAGPHYFLSMEYVDGPNLRQAERAGKIEPAQAIAIVVQICAALEYAHRSGIVHRDIKPENVLLTRDGRVKIVDFGLAKVLDRAARGLSLTRVSQTMGTPHYMAPEQVEHPKDVDHRADIYSLGVVFYELLTGELPLGRFPLPSERVRIDVRLDDIVIRTLEKEPERRYQAASEVRTAVQHVADSPRPTGATPAPAATKHSGSGRRWILVAAGVFGLLLMAGVVGAAMFFVLSPVAVTGSPSPGPNRVASSGPSTANGAETSTSPPAPFLDSRSLVARLLRPELSRWPDARERAGVTAAMLGAVASVEQHDALSRYLRHEAESVAPLPREDVNEVLAIRIAADGVVVRDLRDGLRREIRSLLDAEVLPADQLAWIVEELMPFGSQDLDVRIVRAPSEWIVTTSASGEDRTTETFTELPARYRRLLERYGASAGSSLARITAPSPILSTISPPVDTGTGASEADAIVDREDVRQSTADISRRYLQLERAHTQSLAGLAPGELMRLRIEAFPRERDELVAEFWTEVVNSMPMDDAGILMGRNYDREVLPFGDHIYEISISRRGDVWTVRESSPDGDSSTERELSELPQPYARLLARTGTSK